MYYMVCCHLFFHGKLGKIYPVEDTDVNNSVCLIDALFPYSLFLGSWVIVSFWIAFSKSVVNSPSLRDLQGIKLYVKREGQVIANFDAYVFLKKRAFRHP